MSTDENMTQEMPETADVIEDADTEAKIMSKTADALYELDQEGEEGEEAPTDMTEEVTSTAAQAAREERMRLMPEYLNHFFLEDLPPIDPEDPFNQGIYMRYRINQMRSAQGKEPVQ